MCYFQHYTTFVITLLIVLMNIETNFFNKWIYFLFVFSTEKKCDQSFYKKRDFVPFVISSKMNLATSFDFPCLTYFYNWSNNNRHNRVGILILLRIVVVKAI